jgi:hypothetical protein
MRSKKSVAVVDSKLALFEDSLSKQKTAFEAQTLSIATQFNDQELKRQTSKTDCKASKARLLAAILSIKNKTSS